MKSFLCTLAASALLVAAAGLGMSSTAVGSTGPGDGDELKRLRLGAAPATCRVPRVVGLRLSVAKRRIRRAGCAVGRGRFVRATGPRNRVLRQSIRPGRRVRTGTRINLVIDCTRG